MEIVWNNFFDCFELNTVPSPTTHVNDETPFNAKEIKEWIGKGKKYNEEP
jgi:hypothetical protein